MEVKEKIKKTIQKHTENGHSVNGSTVINKRIPVLKTYKLYINGQFPRTESGRYYKLTNRDGKVVANICRGSRKDFRDAVVAARKAQEGWQKKVHLIKVRYFIALPKHLKHERHNLQKHLCCKATNIRQQSRKCMHP